MFHRFAFAAAIATMPSLGLAQDGPFTQNPLPYAADALEPAISAQTMDLHHGKHHKAYVDALNKAAAEDDSIAGKSVEELVANAGTYAPVVRNNAGGHWNHTFFWESMAPEGERGEMSPELTAAITETFGSEQAFREAFEKAGAAQFGSGWVWLIVDDQNKLQITSTPNQDNPLMDVAEVKGTPILGNDVWEHAYYLTYQNRRPEYLTAWWDVVDYEKMSERFKAAQAD